MELSSTDLVEDIPAQHRELELDGVKGPFQPWLFYEPMNLWYNEYLSCEERRLFSGSTCLEVAQFHACLLLGLLDVTKKSNKICVTTCLRD